VAGLGRDGRGQYYSYRGDILKIDLQGRAIGEDLPPFIIAEMSGNHNQSARSSAKDS